MNNFFIPKLSGRKMTKLKRSETPYIEMEIDEVDGIILESDQIMNCLKVLRLDVKSSETTSIPGIIKLSVINSGTVTFNLDEQIEELGVIVSKPHGAKCRHWDWLLDEIKKWAVENLSHLKRVVIHEAYVNKEVKLEVSNDELHLVLGEYLHLDSAMTDSRFIEYYPAGNIICFKSSGFNSCPDDGDFTKVISGIKKYLEVVLAKTIEEANNLLPLNVSFASWDGSADKHRVADIVRNFISRNSVNEVIISVPHGRTEAPIIVDDKINIFLWSSPEGERIVTTPSYMWDFSVSCTDTSFAPTNNALAICDEEGHAVAEVVGSNLYIFHDIFHHGYTEDYKIFEKILEQAVILFKLTEAEKLEFINRPRVDIFSRPKKIHNQSGFKQVTEEVLLPIIMKPVVVNSLDGKSIPPIDDQAFKIFIYASSFGEAKKYRRLPNKLFNYHINNDWPYLESSGSGIEIIDEESSFALAELLENNLYIHLPINYSEFEGGLNIYRRILELTVIELNRTPEERIERLKEIKEIRRQKTLASYLDICQKRLVSLMEQSESELVVTREKIFDYQKLLVEKIRRESELSHQLDSLRIRKKSDNPEFEAEFDRLYNIEGVESVSAQSNKIIITTYNIYITTRDSRGSDVTFDIGRFRIEIYFDGSNGGILFFNITRRGAGGYNNYNIHHPHVNKEGQPCLGNIKEMIPQLIAEYQFAAIVALAIQYLETVNLDDQAGSEIFKCWPKVGESESEKEVVNV